MDPMGWGTLAVDALAGFSSSFYSFSCCWRRHGSEQVAVWPIGRGCEDEEQEEGVAAFRLHPHNLYTPG